MMEMKAKDANEILRTQGADALRDAADKAFTAENLEAEDLGAVLVANLKKQQEEQQKQIAALAAKDPIAYDQERKKTAKKLGVRVSTLDKTVTRRRVKIEEEELEAELFKHWQVKRWSKEIVGEKLLKLIEERLKKHVVMTPEAAVSVTLWIMLTWAHDAAVHSPILLVTSPEPDSGKSTLLSVVEMLARRSLSSVGISPAALYRCIDRWHPTLIIDEADATFADNDDLRACVNSGWTRGAGVLRCEGDENQVKLFSTFAPKAIGLKGKKIPDTTASRAIVIEMSRKLPDEVVENFDHIDSPEFKEIRARALRWTEDNLEPLKRAAPALPDGFTNRLAANWRLMIAIADAAGGDWPKKARKSAAVIAKNKATIDAGRGVELLADTRDVFDRLGVDRLLSRKLIEELAVDPEKPWAEYRPGKQITQKQMANLLRPYFITSSPIWIGDVSARGYMRSQFEDAWKRYLA
jgi:putative DNA primase/helicase